jgi:glutamate dehydrogenase (NADP+)
MNSYIGTVLDGVKRRSQNEPLFLQAVEEVLESIAPVVEKHKEFQDKGILERIVEPERQNIFRVPWQDDKEKFHVKQRNESTVQFSERPVQGRLKIPSVVITTQSHFWVLRRILKYP